MNTLNINQPSVIRQCVDLLKGIEKFSCPLLNYDHKKLTIEALIQIFIAAQLGKWDSYSDFEEKIRADKDFMNSLSIKSISGSQLSRRINDLPTEWVQELFFKQVSEIQKLTSKMAGLPNGIGRLAVLDSTSFKLPELLSSWAYLSKTSTQVKMHTRLIIASPEISYPDKIVPSTGNVSDFEGSDVLVEEADATYVMDRGYACHKRINRWAKDNLSFVVRIKDQHKVIYLERKVLSHPLIRLDAKVMIGVTQNIEMIPVRLIEFWDEEGHLYRIITTRFDIPPEEIMEIYKKRWEIELFFKWLKQHLRTTKIWSTKPQGIWNQMFLAMIAYGLILQIKLILKTKKTTWVVLRLVRTYLHRPWEKLIEEMNRKKSRTSKGRQKIPDRKAKKLVLAESVAIIKEKKK
jgi:hypothetical protein